VTAGPPFKPPSIAVPIGVLAVAMVSIQLGAVLAKQLLPVVGAAGATALRLGLASLMLLAVWRPWRLRPTGREARSIVIYGLAMGTMNLFFYSSLNRIPLGIAVAVEFTGPLAVALAASRRPSDFAWIALAAVGLIALLPGGLGRLGGPVGPLGPLGPLGLESKPLDPAGVGFALGAGLCWALYIVYGKRAGTVHGGQTAALGTVAAALVIVPIGIGQAGMALFSGALLPAALGMALLSSALPYSLELYSLTRMPTRTFGVLMSVEPALGALSGLLFLRETLSLMQWAAIASIMIASGGITFTSRGTPAGRAAARTLPD
jgi:inner membrane transporter RhtA